jgi:hypothetical protein
MNGTFGRGEKSQFKTYLKLGFQHYYKTFKICHQPWDCMILSTSHKQRENFKQIHGTSIKPL